jgi:drug/metabolite transporter (DMT)-like permease
VGPVDASFLRLLAGVLGLLVGGLLVGRLRDWRAGILSRSVFPVLALAAFFGTFLGIGLNQAGIAWATSTGVVSTINALAPVWLIPLSTLFLGERHGARAWISTILALTGVALLSWRG